MKKIIFAVIALMVAVISNAQDIGTEILEGHAYVEVDMKCKSSDMDQVKIMFDQQTAKKFLHKLQKTMSEAQKMAATAKKNGVKSYNKTMQGSFSFSKLIFDNEDGTNIADKNQNNYLVPYFNVDSQGNSFVTLGGYYSGYNTSNMGSNYTKRNKFFLYMKLPVNKSSKWCENFDLAISDAQIAQNSIDNNELLMTTRSDPYDSEISNKINSEEKTIMPSILTILTTPPYGVIILVAVLAIIILLVLKKRKR